MRVVLALGVFLIPASVMAEESSRTEKPRLLGICNKSGEQVSGLTKICYYTCAKTEGGMKVTTYEACPSWTPRWRLSRNIGPSAISR